MHIAVNALLVSGAFTGVQHAILHQLRALLRAGRQHRITVIALRDVPIEAYLDPEFPPHKIIHAPVASNRRIRRILWEQFSLPRVLADEDIELLYAPGYLNTLRWDGPSVVFIHDTIALSHPHLCRHSNALNYRLLLPASARRATLVATPSHVSADDVMSYCHVPESRIRVVPLGVDIPPPPTAEDIAAAREKLGVDAPYLLAVSAIEPKKNFDNLLRWFDTWKSAGLPHHLVIVGNWAWGYGEVLRAMRRVRFREAIHFTGYLLQSEISPIMAGAELLLVPSRYEGFGLPVLEAMAVGTPVVVSDRGALPETAGQAGMVVPLDSLLWRAEIPTLLNHPERLQTMREAGLARAREFSWERTAEGLLAVFDEAVAPVE